MHGASGDEGAVVCSIGCWYDGCCWDCCCCGIGCFFCCCLLDEGILNDPKDISDVERLIFSVIHWHGLPWGVGSFSFISVAFLIFFPRFLLRN